MSATVSAPAATAAPVDLGRALLYGLASLLLGLTQGLGSNLVVVNLQAAQANFSATANEAMWLSTAYTAVNITATLLLFKVRAQFGIRVFAELGLAVLVAVSLAHLLAHDLVTAVILRGASGLAAAPLGTLALLYMLEHLPVRHKLGIGLAFALAGAQLAAPLARLLSPDLLDRGLWLRLDLLELSLALLCLAAVLWLPLPGRPRVQAFDRADAVSLPLLVIGMGLVATAINLGRYYWWTEAPWLGACLAAGIAALTLHVAIELNRQRPCINLRWLLSGEMLAFAGSLLAMRFLLAVQNTGTAAFFQNLGLLNEQMAGLFMVVLAATLCGHLAVAPFNRPQNAPAIHAVALLLVATGALLATGLTSQTRPQDLYLSQALIGFAAGLFLPAAMCWSLARVLLTAPQNLMSYIGVFLVAQNLGGLAGSAGLGSLLVLREKFHSSQIVETLTPGNPIVAQRIQGYGGTYAPVLGDGMLRQAEGVVALGQVATREAYVLAYADLFLVTAAAALLCLALLFIHLLVLKLRAGASQSRVQVS